MAATPAIAALQRRQLAHTVHKYDHDPRAESFGDEAVDRLSQRLGVAPEQILKTLVVDVGATLAVAIIPVPARLSLKSISAALAFSAKATMADATDVQRITGYVLGGVSPLGQRTALPTVIDVSATTWPTVLCSAGRRGLEVELSPGDLAAATDAIIADILA